MPVDRAVYDAIKVQEVHGRYLPLDKVLPVLKPRENLLSLRSIGESVLGEPIFQLGLGHGPIKVLMWSQMHGNESTTTKALLDLLSFLCSGHEGAAALLKACTLRVLPMLNPDGARAYTRVNANGVDLNRDAQQLTQPESRVLAGVYEEFGPDYCFNLHDQRTIFNVGDTPLPASLSFLTPAEDAERTITLDRTESMKVIAAINHSLQQLIPGQVGRYDDSFNLNCVGDTFQSRGTPTLLFEAGHFPGDYQREHTRELVFQALFTALEALSTATHQKFEVSDYLAIPENSKLFFDFLVRNPAALDPQWEEGVCLGILYQEVLERDTVHFRPKLQEVGLLQGKYGHTEIDCTRAEDLAKLREVPDLMGIIS